MEKNEFAKLVKGLKASYPNFKIIESKEGFDMWFAMLSDIPYECVSRSILRHISTNKYPPSIAEIRQGVVDDLNGTAPSDWSSGWSLVLKSVRLFGSYREEEALSWIGSQDITASRVAKALGYQSICASENISVERANFRMAYEGERERERYRAALPEGLKHKAAPELTEDKKRVLKEMVSGI